MASGALFGNTGSRSQSKHLVEFRAGKMHMKGKMVHPDKRKGQVYVYQSDDMLMHFCWKDRTKGTVEDDLIIFPEDVEFKHVVQCTTGRAYVLKFKSTSRKMFFWMQEPKTDKDDEFCRKVNDFLNNPPEPGSRSQDGRSGLSSLPPELAAGLGGDSDIQNLLGNMTQPQLMQLFGGIGGLGGLSSLLGGRPGSSQSDSNPPSRVQSSPGARAGTRPAEVTSSSQPTRPLTAAAIPETHAAQSTPPPTQTPAADQGDSSRQAQIQLSDLQNILTGLGGEEGKEKESIDLAAAITPDAMIPILANSEIQERLIAFLPEGESLPKTEEELRSTVKSPQFQQALQSFGAALTSGELGPLMAQFDLGEDVVTAATAGDLEAFTKAMQEALKKKEEKMDDEDEEMKE